MPVVLDVHGQPIDPLWAAEFRGFFMGEGSLMILNITRRGADGKQRRFLRPCAAISLRADAYQVLREVQSKLGGAADKYAAGHPVISAEGKAYSSAPMVKWYTHSSEGVTRVLDIVENPLLPYTKAKEIRVMREYLALRPATGRKLTDELRDQLWALKEELQAMRRYAPPS